MLKAMVEAAGIHLPTAYGVEAFWRLPVALLDLGAQAAGPGANGIGAEMLEPAVLELPDLKLGFFLENPDEDRGFLLHPFNAQKRLR